METLRRVWYWWRQRRQDAELAEELAAHRTMAEEAHEAAGAAPAEAAWRARRQVGNGLLARERARDVWIAPWLQDMATDLRMALRLVIRAPAFTVMTVAILGVGIGVNHFFLTLVYAHVIRGFAIDRPERVLYVSASDNHRADRRLSYREFDAVRQHAPAFAGLTAFTTATSVVSGDGHGAERYDSAFVSANGFDVIGVRPILGRTFMSADDRPGAARVLMLSASVWRGRYGAAADVLGRTVGVDGEPAVVIGVLPDRSGFPAVAEIWLPLEAMHGLHDVTTGGISLRVFGRLRDGASVADGSAQVEAVVRGTSSGDAATYVRARAVPIDDRFFGSLEGPWLAFLCAGLIVVVIAAANVANVMLERSFRRGRELAVRTALGASRLRIARQLVMESTVLAVLGGALGVILSLAAVRVFAAAIPPNLLPYWVDYSPDARVAMSLVAVLSGTLTVFGVAPAMAGSRAGRRAVLMGRSRVTLDARRRPWMAGLLVVQLSLGVVLLSLLVFTVRNNGAEVPSDKQVDTEDVLTAQVMLPADRYGGADERRLYYNRLIERVRAVPGVESVALASALPRRGADPYGLDWGGPPTTDEDATPRTFSIAVSRDYFRTLGLGLLAGSDFAETASGGGRAVIVNEQFRARFLEGAQAIGHSLVPRSANQPPSPGDRRVIVGRAPDIRQRPADEPDPLVYTSFLALPPATAALLVRASAGTTLALADVRSAALAVDPVLPLYHTMSLAAALDEIEWNGRVAVRLLLLVTGVSVGLSIVGLYAVLAYVVSTRTREVGLRMALGASAWRVARLVAGRELGYVMLAVVLGMLGSAAWERAFATTGATGVRITDAEALACAVAIMAGLVSLACLQPVRRAVRANLAGVLKGE